MGKSMCVAPGCDREYVYIRDGHEVCKKHYQRLRTHGSFEVPPKKKPEWATCSIDGCCAKSRTVGGKFCEKHYYRNYRNNTFTDPVTGKEGVTSHGYVWCYAPVHPLAGPSGVLYKHRVVLHDHIGGGVHQCNWCCEEVEWGAKGKRKLVADHLDNNKENNTTDNLVASCNTCNATRGLFMSWVLKHKDDPFLARLFEAANDNRPSQRGSQAMA